MSNDNYDLKESEKAIGQLLPIIKDAHGRIVDGLHREKANPYWKAEIHESIKTDEDYWKQRAHLNFGRRNAHEARQEKFDIINNLAEYYLKKGYQVMGSKPDNAGQGGGSASPKNEVLDAVIKALKGAIPESWIRQNINRKYLQEQNKKQVQEISATQRIKNKFGKEIVEKFQQETKKKLEKEMKEKTNNDDKVNEYFSRKNLEEKRSEIINQLDNEVDRKAVAEEVEKGDLTIGQIKARVDEIQYFKSGFQPALLNMFKPEGEGVVDAICKPLERFSQIEISALNDLSSEQKTKVSDILNKSQNKIAEWIKAITKP